MTAANLAFYIVFLAVVTVLAKPTGIYMARVFSGATTWPDRVLRPIEKLIYRVSGVNTDEDMSWWRYASCFMAFTIGVGLLVFLILVLQSSLPWHDDKYLSTPMSWDLAANTAVSFATTTTWQAYGGETTMSYFSQMAALTMANFLAGAGGLAVGIAFIRGFAREQSEGLGNFWVDVVRGCLWVLLPIAMAGSLLLVWQGVPANLNEYTPVTTLEGSSQTIAQGPVAALEFIKNLGTNGGGFFNVNGAHPLANPTALTNFLGMLAIVVLPAGLTYTFGRMTGRQREGWLLFAVMAVLFIAGLAISGGAEQAGNPKLAEAGILRTAAGDGQAGGNMEGKDVRFGIGSSVLTAIVTSNGATGSFNSMHDSYTSLGNMPPLVNMLLGELAFGGLGSGIYSLVMMVPLTLFFAGLMVGRTPQYLGKRIGPDETKQVVLYTVAFPAVVLLLTAFAVITDSGKAGPSLNSGAHAFTQILFAYASSTANNGLTMASLDANTEFYNLTTAVAMLAGRFALPVIALAVAGRFARQTRRRETSSTLPTASFTFAGVLISVIAIIGGLSYFVALALGPIAERLAGGA